MKTTITPLGIKFVSDSTFENNLLNDLRGCAYIQFKMLGRNRRQLFVKYKGLENFLKNAYKLKCQKMNYEDYQTVLSSLGLTRFQLKVLMAAYENRTA